MIKAKRILLIAFVFLAPSLFAQSLGACSGTALAAGTYTLTANVGSDPTAACFFNSFPAGAVIINLNGHTVTGYIDLSQTNQSGNKVVGPGTINATDPNCSDPPCAGIMLATQDTVDGVTLNMSSANNCTNAPAAITTWSSGTTYSVGQCASSGGVLYRSLQNANLNHAVGDGVWWTTGRPCGGLMGINFNGTESTWAAPLSGKVINSTLTLGRCDGANRTQMVRSSTASGFNPALRSISLEVAYNTITISDNASSAQGVEVLVNRKPSIHDNTFNLPQSCLTCQDSARAAIFDVTDGGSFYSNTVNVYSNRGVRVRSCNTGVAPCGLGYGDINIYSNTFNNIQNSSRFGAIHIGENDNELQQQVVHVFSNTFQLGSSGNGVACLMAANCDVHDNIVTCTPNCTSVGYLGLADVTANYGLTGTFLNLLNNDISALTAAGKNAATACSGAACTQGTGSTTINLCNSGTATGTGTVNANCRAGQPAIGTSTR